MPLGSTPGERDLSYWESQNPAPSSYVYVISEEQVDNLVKIGVAKNVKSRIAGLQTGNPRRLQLRYLLVGDRELEWHLHKRFDPFRTLGEWFSGSFDDALSEIALLAGRMREAHEAGGQIPSFQRFSEWHFKRDRRGRTCKVSYVAPEPVERKAIDPERKAIADRRVKEEFRWLQEQPVEPFLP